MQEQEVNKEAQEAPELKWKWWRIPSRALRFVSRICDPMRIRYAMQCVRVEADTEGLTLVATDGRMLLVSKHNPWLHCNAPANPIKTLIHRKLARSLSGDDSVMLSDDGDVSIGLSRGSASFTQIHEAGTNGKYPDWKGVLLEYSGNRFATVKVNVDHLKKLLETMQRLCDDDYELRRNGDSQFVYLSINSEKDCLVLQSRRYMDVGVLLGAEEPDES